MSTMWRYLPRGNMLDDAAWHRRHKIVLIVLALHVPALFIFGLAMAHPVVLVTEVVTVPLLCAILGYAVKRRRMASVFTTAGLTCCSVALVGFTNGSIESHFHFFVIIGFIALYQDWVPFLWNVIFTLLSHGIGSLLFPGIIFNHLAGQHEPWVWSGIHALAVAFACTGVVLFWRVSEDDQHRASLAKRRADSEAERRRFTSDLLVNLARRNQKMLYRQLEIINQLEHKESDPDALAELFRLEHLATRVRRNAESLLVLSGEATSRVWSAPVPLREVVQAAIAETEDLARVSFQVDEHLAVAGHCVADLTHLLAELAENAVRFSPPGSTVSIAQRPYPQLPGAQLITIEDWGVGMPPAALNAANRLLGNAPEVDLSESRQLGFHVVARLAKRHNLKVSLTPTPGCGITAAVVIPAELFGAQTEPPIGHGSPVGQRGRPALIPGAAAVGSRSALAPPPARPERSVRAVEWSASVRTFDTSWPAEQDGRWDGWWKTTDDDGGVDGAPAGNGSGPANGSGRGNGSGWVNGSGSMNGGATITSGAAALPASPPRPVDRPEPRNSRPTAGSGSANGAARPVVDLGRGDRDDGPKLNRRRPQTHLAPELRHPVPRPRSEQDALDQDGPPTPDPSALSRYQASRHAAQEAAARRDLDTEQE